VGVQKKSGGVKRGGGGKVVLGTQTGGEYREKQRACGSDLGIRRGTATEGKKDGGNSSRRKRGGEWRQAGPLGQKKLLVHVRMRVKKKPIQKRGKKEWTEKGIGQSKKRWETRGLQHRQAIREKNKYHDDGGNSFPDSGSGPGKRWRRENQGGEVDVTKKQNAGGKCGKTTMHFQGEKSGGIGRGGIKEKIKRFE